MKQTMKKQILRLMVAMCFVFGVMGVSEYTNSPFTTTIVAHATNEGGEDNTTTSSDKTQSIEADDNATLKIQLDSNGGLKGGIASGKNGKDGTITTGNKILGTLSLVFTIVLAAASIILGIIFVIHCVSLAKDGNNPQGKSASINGLIMTAVAAVLCGGACVFLGMFFNVFR